MKIKKKGTYPYSIALLHEKVGNKILAQKALKKPQQSYTKAYIAYDHVGIWNYVITYFSFFIS